VVEFPIVLHSNISFKRWSKFRPIFMFEFYLIPMAFRMRTENFTSKFHNLGNWIPIYTWDTSINLWMNFLLFYIQIFL